jgi:pimeloyl-ACP methyl ester carboxylesterase
MRAREPDVSGFVEREGVRVWWERAGDGDPAILFFHADPIVDSQMWKAQIPWFARRHTVLAFDPRGNGRSDRPSEANAYADDEFITDAIAVLDANDIQRAVVVGLCQGAGVSLVFAANHPDRVSAVVAINPGLRLTVPHAHRARAGFYAEPVGDDGWALENRHHWLRDWQRYTEFFFGEMFPEAHSTKQCEDCVDWSLVIGAETMLVNMEAPAAHRSTEIAAEQTCRQVRCPVLVINGDQDQCQPPARSHAVADLTGGELVVLQGAGHLPNARDPVKVNLEIADFVRRRVTVAPR